MNRTGIAVSRREAIDALGVRYTHSGRPGASVRERLGAIGVPEDPMNPVVTFSTDEEALQYAVELTRSVARQEFLDASGELEAFKGSKRIWLARNWQPARRWYREDLAAVSILERRIAAAKKTIAGTSYVSIERLDDVICVPATLAVGTKVYAVDTSSFPRRPVTFQALAISEIHYLETPGHPLFHVVPRYKIEGMQGYYAYDHADTDEEALGSPSFNGPTIFIDEDAAQRRVSLFVNSVRDMLERGPQPTIMLPPPAPLAGLISSATVPQQSDHAIDLVAAPGEPESIEQLWEPEHLTAIDVAYEVHDDAGPSVEATRIDVEPEAGRPVEEVSIVHLNSLPPSDHVEAGHTELQAEPQLGPLTGTDQAMPGNPSRGLGALLSLIGGRRQVPAAQQESQLQAVLAELDHDVARPPQGEFARFAANGVKIRRWDNADGRESLARIALEALS